MARTCFSKNYQLLIEQIAEKIILEISNEKGQTKQKMKKKLQMKKKNFNAFKWWWWNNYKF